VLDCELNLAQKGTTMVTKQFYWSEDLAEQRVFGKRCALAMVNGLIDAGYFAGARLVYPVGKGHRVAVYAVHFERVKEAYQLANELQSRFEHDPYER